MEQVCAVKSARRSEQRHCKINATVVKTKLSSRGWRQRFKWRLEAEIEVAGGRDSSGVKVSTRKTLRPLVREDEISLKLLPMLFLFPANANFLERSSCILSRFRTGIAPL